MIRSRADTSSIALKLLGTVRVLRRKGMFEKPKRIESNGTGSGRAWTGGITRSFIGVFALELSTSVVNMYSGIASVYCGAHRA